MMAPTRSPVNPLVGPPVNPVIPPPAAPSAAPLRTSEAQASYIACIPVEHPGTVKLQLLEAGSRQFVNGHMSVSVTFGEFGGAKTVRTNRPSLVDIAGLVPMTNATLSAGETHGTGRPAESRPMPMNTCVAGRQPTLGISDAFVST